MFKIVKHEKAPQQIIQQIRTSILTGELMPGDKLASEGELMEDFSVSKSTLREALRTLEYMRLIEMRKGAKGGAFVTEVDMEITRESLENFLHFKNLSIHHISEIRKNLDPYASRIAAQKMGPEDLKRLKDINDLCQQAYAKGDMEILQQNIIHFHRVITSATDNPILILIKDFLDSLLDTGKSILIPDSTFSEQVLKSHDLIYKAILARDPDKAWRETLDDVTMVEQELTRLSENAYKNQFVLS